MGLTMNVSYLKELVLLFYCTDKTALISAIHQTTQNHLIVAIKNMVIYLSLEGAHGDIVCACLFACLPSFFPPTLFYV